MGTVTKASLTFNKYPNLMDEYLGNKRCLDDEYIWV